MGFFSGVDAGVVRNVELEDKLESFDLSSVCF